MHKQFLPCSHLRALRMVTREKCFGKVKTLFVRSSFGCSFVCNPCSSPPLTMLLISICRAGSPWMALIQRLSTCCMANVVALSQSCSVVHRRATLSLPLCPRGGTFLPQCSTQYSMGRYRCYRPPTTTVVSSCVVSVGVTCEKENCNDVHSMRHFLSAFAWQRD